MRRWDDYKKTIQVEDEIFDLCRTGDLDRLVFLKDLGLRSGKKNSKGHSPLMLAAYHGNLNVVKFLIQHGAIVSEVNALFEIARDSRVPLVNSFGRWANAPSGQRAHDRADGAGIEPTQQKTSDETKGSRRNETPVYTQMRAGVAEDRCDNDRARKISRATQMFFADEVHRVFREVQAQPV